MDKDFFDVIEEYENKLSNDIKRRLMLNLDNQSNMTQVKESNGNGNEYKLYGEIISSKAICGLIAEKRKKNKKLFILALNAMRSKVNGCFNQVGFNNDYFYSQRTESLMIKQIIVKDITRELESLFQKERQMLNYIKTNNTTMKVLNPIKMTKRSRYRNENGNNVKMKQNNNKNWNDRKKNNNYGNNSNIIMENIKENKINKLKQDNLAQVKKRVDQLIIDDDILLKKKGEKTKLNFQRKFEIKANNKKRILSCRVVIQDKNG